MPTRVRSTPYFDNEYKRLRKKYPLAKREVENLVERLKADERPGDKIPNVGYDVYKERLKNPSANRGKRGGFRVIYYLYLADEVIMLIIYSKTEQEDVSIELIQQVIEDVLPTLTDSDDTTD
jgi:mRNA-degrading endonuclease RelE of RelBE toxin-antitoxin system